MAPPFTLSLKGDGQWADLPQRDAVYWNPTDYHVKVACLENGTASGRASVAVRVDFLDDEDNTISVVAEVTMRQWLAMCQAVTTRFGPAAALADDIDQTAWRMAVASNQVSIEWDAEGPDVDATVEILGAALDCPQCGRRLYGKIRQRGVCLDCQPEEEA